MYTIKEAASRAGLTPTVARAWERRYGVVEPARASSGYRLYDEIAIERLRTMRLLVEDGWTPSAAARAVADGTAPPVAARGAGRAPGSGVSADPIEEFVAAAAALDGDRIEAALDELFGRGSFESIVDTWLMSAAAALGDAWAAGRVTVAGEQAASAALARRLAGAVRRRGPRGRAADRRRAAAGSRHRARRARVCDCSSPARPGRSLSRSRCPRRKLAGRAFSAATAPPGRGSRDGGRPGLGY